MRSLARFVALAALASAVSAHGQDQLPPGIWTNVEDVYFANEEGRERQAEVMFEVAEDGRWRAINTFGEPQGDWQTGQIAGLSRRDGGSGWQIFDSELRKARRFSCWMSVRKFAGKPDGSADWTFMRGLDSFDQGGRVTLRGNGEAPDITFRLRNVTWAAGSRNRPSLVAAGETWRGLYEAGDWEAVRALYADDAVLMTQWQEKIEGADNIVAFLQRLTNMGAKVGFRFEPEEARVDNDLGFVTARYRMDIAFPGSDPAVVTGRSLLIYKRIGGEWRLWRDMDNLAPDVTPENFAP